MSDAKSKNDDKSGNKGTEPTQSFDSSMIGQGRQIGPFRIERELGRGGAGVVYLAHDTKLDRSVAIKSLPPEVKNNHKALSRFTREARVLASLNHPNIATIYEELEEAEGVDYLILEYVPGQTLAERIAGARLKPQEALSIAQQIAEAVAAAHEHDVIHRDLKPGNIKITPEGKVKVLDFGLAKALGGEAVDQQSTVTEPGRIIGTPAYMSPEQARGQPTDKRSDIWSFGCVLYEMLTGKVPFEGETVSDTLANILQTEPEWESLPQSTPANIKVLLRRCLEKDPRRRLRDIGDASIEISETLNLTAGTFVFPGAVRTARYLTRSRIIAVGLLMTVGLSFVVFAIIGGRLKRRPIVVMMDTAMRPYDEQDRERGITNADVISDFLADFGVLDLRKESTHPQWNREDVIVSWNPDLIIIHFSCFQTETVERRGYAKLSSFLEYVAGSTDSHILMYSRGRNFWAGESQGEFRRVATLPSSNEFLRDYENRFQLKGRLTMMGFTDENTTSFRDPSVVRRMKLEVKRILHLEDVTLR